MVDAGKGIHSIATTIFIALLVYVTYPYFNSFFTGVSYDVFKYILWATYVLVIITTAGITPIIISTVEETDASIFSALGGFGLYALGALIMRIATPFAQIFVGEGYSGVLPNAVTNGSLTAAQGTQAIGWVSVLWIVAVVFLLIILPVAMSTAPHMFEPTIKVVREKVGM